MATDDLVFITIVKLFVTRKKLHETDIDEKW